MKLVNTADLKSAAYYWACRFKSGRGHHPFSENPNNFNGYKVLAQNFGTQKGTPMSTPTPVEALKGFAQKPLQSYAVTRREWLPFIENAETFLAEDETHAREIAEDLKEELRILIGDSVGEGGSQALYNQLLVASWETVSITPVTIQPVASCDH